MEAALPATVQVAIIAADRFDPVPNEWVLYDWLARINRHTVTPSHANHASKYSTSTSTVFAESTKVNRLNHDSNY